MEAFLRGVACVTGHQCRWLALPSSSKYSLPVLRLYRMRSSNCSACVVMSWKVLVMFAEVTPDNTVASD